MERVKEFDKDDAVFVACVLAHPESILWSEDKKLKKQNRIKIMNTTEIMMFLKK